MLRSLGRSADATGSGTGPLRVIVYGPRADLPKSPRLARTRRWTPRLLTSVASSFRVTFVLGHRAAGLGRKVREDPVDPRVWCHNLGVRVQQDPEFPSEPSPGDNWWRGPGEGDHSWEHPRSRSASDPNETEANVVGGPGSRQEAEPEQRYRARSALPCFSRIDGEAGDQAG